MKKKVVSIIFIGLFLSILIINFISALSFYEGINSVWNNIKTITTPILQFFFGNIAGGLLLNKILIFIIILLLSWVGLKKSDFLSDYPIISKILVFAVAILAMKGIGSSELINAMLLPYTATGVALSAGLPFLIYFAVVNIGLGEQPIIVRRIAWIFFAVIFFGLLASRIGGIWNILNPSTWGFYWIYILTASIALAMAFLDGSIRKFFMKAEADKLDNIKEIKLGARLRQLKKEYQKMNEEDIISDKEYKKLMKNLALKAKRYKIKKWI